MPDKSYVWFQGKSVERLTEDLIEAGDGARLEIHPVGDFVIPPDTKFHLVVKSPDHPGKDPINDSHICPPDCG